MHDAILVLCRNAQQAGLIARTLRFREVNCLPMPFETTLQQALAHSPRGLILCADGFEPDALDGLDFSLLSAGIPVLALGGAAAQLCVHFGGSFALCGDDHASVTLGLTDEALFQQIDSGERKLGRLAELTLPDSLSPIATATERIIGFRHRALELHAMQYPIERNDPDAAQLLYNFAVSVCGVAADWTDEAIIQSAVSRIREAAPEGRVLCAVSGGVDSAVCAKLASMAVGDRLMCVFVDTGLFRQDEPERVIHTYMESMGLVVAHVDATDTFLRALNGVSSPSDKERIASQLMTQVLIKQINYDPEIRTIVKGTNFNDQLFGVPAGENEKEAPLGDLTVCEPINDLFKVEIRRLGTALDLPSVITARQPFPTSGLALRVMSSVDAEKLQLLRTADAIFTEEIRNGGYDRRLWQYYATLTPNPDHPDTFAVILRATQAAQNGAYAARIPSDVLERASERIRSELPIVKRVVYDLTPSKHYSELE